MKKLTINVVRALLCIIVKSFLICMFLSILLTLLLTASSSSAQQPAPAPLTVGSQLPVDLWKAPLVSVRPNGDKFLSLQDFKGKAIIIDFWTTWCAPCLANMPTLDSIHYANKGQLQVIMMNASASQIGFVKERKFIRDYLLARKKFHSPLVLRNDLFRQYLYFRIVPHYVWIGADGKIKALTDHLQFSPTNIAKFISGADLDLEIKTH